jgi:hypothetical protein
VISHLVLWINAITLRGSHSCFYYHWGSRNSINHFRGTVSLGEIRDQPIVSKACLRILLLREHRYMYLSTDSIRNAPIQIAFLITTRDLSISTRRTCLSLGCTCTWLEQRDARSDRFPILYIALLPNQTPLPTEGTIFQVPSHVLYIPLKLSLFELQRDVLLRASKLSIAGQTLFLT